MRNAWAKDHENVGGIGTTRGGALGVCGEAHQANGETEGEVLKHGVFLFLEFSVNKSDRFNKLIRSYS
jgi:hypothetical protein